VLVDGITARKRLGIDQCGPIQLLKRQRLFRISKVKSASFYALPCQGKRFLLIRVLTHSTATKLASLSIDAPRELNTLLLHLDDGLS
jgi:hypothetical protein